MITASYYTISIKGGGFLNNAVLAVDIGASSGRLILAWMKDNKLELEELHRFKNSMTYDGKHYHWDIDALFNEIIEGLKKASNVEGNIDSIGIDTWAVDYVLINEEGERVAPVFAYRDHRTDETMDKVFEEMSRAKIYAKTGIQFLQFNSLYQLYEHVKADSEDFDKASQLLMVPDYLNYRLSKVAAIEYTNATSTQLLNVHSNTWDEELLDLVGINKELLPTPIKPGTILGGLTKEIGQEVNLEHLKVIAPATHDTGSAIVSVPAIGKDFAYISSGTWSLMGIESDKPVVSELSSEFNFTNEGGVFDTYRVLKNIMGLWLIQEVSRMYEGKYSFAEFVDLAKESEPFKCLINPNDSRFLNPENMITAIQGFCEESGQYVPATPGELARCIFESLAFLYAQVLEQLRQVSDQPINRIHIIGGGCQNKLLNQMCADFTNCDVYAGPVEATAIGNIAMQMISNEQIADLSSAREIIGNSFDVEVFKPQAEIQTDVKENYNKFRRFNDAK